MDGHRIRQEGYEDVGEKASLTRENTYVKGERPYLKSIKS